MIVVEEGGGGGGGGLDMEVGVVRVGEACFGVGVEVRVGVGLGVGVGVGEGAGGTGRVFLVRGLAVVGRFVPVTCTPTVLNGLRSNTL